MPGAVMTSESSTTETQLIWQEFGDRLRAFIARRVNSDADADDILQDVFLRIHQHAGDVNRADRLTSWLFQVTRNAIIDYYRAPVRRELSEGIAGAALLDVLDTAVPEEDSAADTCQVRAELASCLRPMITRLPPLYREAVALVDLTGLPQVEAAEQLGLSVSGMKSRVQRGRRALKDVLVECCPVQLDAGGRVVDYDRPAPACSSCAGPAEGVAPVEDHGPGQGQCCTPAVSWTDERPPLEVPIRWLR